MIEDEKILIRVSIEERDLVSMFMYNMPGIFSSIVTWNELMPVILKISDHQYTDDSCKDHHINFYDYAWPRTFGMRDDTGKYMFRFNANTLFTDELLIKAAWMAVVDFIKISPSLCTDNAKS